jgi:hypothetical protein
VAPVDVLQERDLVDAAGAGGAAVEVVDIGAETVRILDAGSIRGVRIGGGGVVALLRDAVRCARRRICRCCAR